MRTAILILISLSFLQLKSQDLKKYTGEYYNGSPIKGQADYTYYLNNGEKVKHGQFNYLQTIKTEEGFAKASISGKFKDGFKDGPWQFKVEYKDYNTGKGNLWVTGSTKMASNYHNGVPNGHWSYERNSKSRNKNMTITGYTWSPFNEPILEIVTANYDEGILVGDFLMKNVVMNQFKNIKGKLDNQGFCIGTWQFSSDATEMEFNFYKNVEINSITRNSYSGEVTDQIQLSPKELTTIKSFADGTLTSKELEENYRIKIDTANWIASQFVSLKTTFYNNLFLEKYIGGDKSYSDLNHEFYNIERGIYRVFANTSALKIIALVEIPGYNSSVSRIEFDSKNSLKKLNEIKDTYNKKLTKADLAQLNTSISKAELTIKTNVDNLNKEFETSDIKSRISTLSDDIISKLNQQNRNTQSEINSNYAEQFIAQNGGGNDYNKSRELEKEISENIQIVSDKLIEKINEIKEKAGISNSWSTGGNKKASISNEEMKELEKNLQSLNKSYEQLSQNYAEAITNHYFIETTYIVYDKLKSTSSGIDTYKQTKKPLYNAYQSIFISNMNNLKITNDIAQLSIEINDFLSFTTRVKNLYELNTKELEKALKKLNDSAEAKAKIMN